MRVLLDSSVIVAAFATRGLCADLFELCLAEHKIVISREILEEVGRTLREKIKVPDSVLNDLEKLLLKEGEIVFPGSIPQDSCRDATDLHVLAAAVAGRAEALVSGDKDLLVLKEFRSIPIVTPRQFWDLLRKN